MSVLKFEFRKFRILEIFDFHPYICCFCRCCLYLLQLCRHIHTSKASLFFQSARYCKDLECYVETLGQLTACLHYLKQLMSYCTDGELFLLDDSVVGDSLLLQLEMINTDCFYGRCVGFQVSQVHPHMGESFKD